MAGRGVARWQSGRNERQETAALRELREETGYTGTEDQLQHLGDYQFGNVVRGSTGSSRAITEYYP